MERVRRSANGNYDYKHGFGGTLGGNAALSFGGNFGGSVSGSGSGGKEGGKSGAGALSLGGNFNGGLSGGLTGNFGTYGSRRTYANAAPPLANFGFPHIYGPYGHGGGAAGHNIFNGFGHHFGG